MVRLAWRTLAHRPIRLVITWAGLGVLYFLAATQLGLPVGWCNTTSAIARAQRDIVQFGSAIPRCPQWSHWSL
jgi:hypothetical protein